MGARGTAAGRGGPASTPLGGATGALPTASGGWARSGAGGVGASQSCHASSTATDRAIAISERFSMTFWFLSTALARLRQRTPHRVDELVETTREGRLACDEAETDAVGRRELALPPVGFPQAAPRAVPHHAAPETAPHRETDRPRPGLPAPQQHERGALHARPTPEESLELSSGPEPLRPPESRGCRPGHSVQPVSRRRPLARRRFSTFRPPFVDMRSRNPWVLARRRRFGWNVRFTTSSWCASCAQPAHPTDQLRTPSSGAPAHRGRGAVAAPKIPVLWWAARFEDGVRTRGTAACPALIPTGRATSPVRQATTAGLPKLSTAVDKCVRNSPP
jgi:hypothetical protein